MDTDKLLINYQNLHSCPKQCSLDLFWNESWSKIGYLQENIPKQRYCYIYKWWAEAGGHPGGIRAGQLPLQDWLWAVCQKGCRPTTDWAPWCAWRAEKARSLKTATENPMDPYPHTTTRKYMSLWDHRKYVLASTPTQFLAQSSWNPCNFLGGRSVLCSDKWFWVGSWNAPNEGESPERWSHD